MISLDKLVEIGFTLSQATDISLFFRNVGYLTTSADCVKADVETDKLNTTRIKRSFFIFFL